MFAISALSEIAVKATQITGLAAGREYLRFFFNRVGCISRLYRRHGAITALGRGIGAAFATQVLRISLAMISQRFRFTVVPGTRIDCIVAISMNPRYGLPMIVSKQDRNYSVSEVRAQILEMVHFPSNGSG
jgi:hypothetical protein